MTKRRIPALVLVVAGVLAASGCGSSSKAPGTGGSGTQVPGQTPTTVAPPTTSSGGGGGGYNY